MQRVQRNAAVPTAQLLTALAPFVLCAVLAQVHVMHTLSPFAAGLCVAYFCNGRGGYAAALGCVLGAAVQAQQPVLTVILPGTLALFCGSMAAYGRKVPRKIYFALLVCSGIASVALQASNALSALMALLDAVLVLASTVVFEEMLSGLQALRQNVPLCENQMLALLFLGCALLMGGAQLVVFRLSVIRVLACAAVMVLACCTGPALCACAGLVLAFCCTLSGGADGNIIGSMGVCALAAGYCGRLGKAGSIVGFILCNSIFTLYLNGSTQVILPLGESMVAGLLCALTPPKWMDFLCALFRQSGAMRDAPRAILLAQSMSRRMTALGRALQAVGHAMASARPQEGTADSAQQIAAEQLCQSAEELYRSARMALRGERFDDWAEQAILHRLRISGLEAQGVAVQKRREGLFARVEMEPCGGHRLCKHTVQKAVSMACGVPMQLLQAPCCGTRKKTCTLHYAQVQRLSIRGGVASATKQGSQVSGDVVSSEPLPGGRELVLLCDGMGSGEAAADTAHTAVQLIETLFEADFAQEQILPTVNRMLGMRKTEVFAAVDLCLIDLNQKRCQFIKTCAAPSFLIHHGEAQVIEMAALPIGIVDHVRPAVVEQRLEPGDKIVMMSDGIADAMMQVNPAQVLKRIAREKDETRAAGLLLQFGQQVLGEAHDDMTAVVLQVERGRRCAAAQASQ